MEIYLDPVIKAQQPAGYKDDFAIATNDPQNVVKYIEAVLKCILEAGSILARTKCLFGIQERDFFRFRTYSPNSPNTTISPSTKSQKSGSGKKHQIFINQKKLWTQFRYP